MTTWHLFFRGQEIFVGHTEGRIYGIILEKRPGYSLLKVLTENGRTMFVPHMLCYPYDMYDEAFVNGIRIRVRKKSEVLAQRSKGITVTLKFRCRWCYHEFQVDVEGRACGICPRCNTGNVQLLTPWNLCSAWKCLKLATHQELYSLADGNSVWLYFCEEHHK